MKQTQSNMRSDKESVFKFPYHYSTYHYGIKPSHVGPEQMDDTIYQMYQKWRGIYLRAEGCPEPGQLRVWSGAGRYEDGTCSEGMGYGMLLSVYCGSASNGGQEDFDALYRYYRYYTQIAHGATTEGLMAWLIDANGRAVSGASATDGDLDVGFALVQAARKWGVGGFDYLQEARRQISIMMENFVNHDIYALLSGNDKTGDHVMSAYLMPAWFQTFYDVTGDASWLKVIEFSYKALQKYLDLNPATGLMPYRFNIHTFEVLEEERDKFGWDACRVPWRIATDYLWNGTAHSLLAHDVPFTNAKWFYYSTEGNPANHVESYKLDGTPVGSMRTPTIVGPMAVAAMTDESQQEWLNALYDYLISIPLGEDDEAYFRDAIQMLTLLLISGNAPNFWKM